MTDGTRTRMPALHKELLRIAIFAVGVALLLNVLDSGVALNFVMMALYAALLAQAWNILGGYGGQFSRCRWACWPARAWACSSAL